MPEVVKGYSPEDLGITHPLALAIEAGVRSQSWRDVGQFTIPFHRDVKGVSYDLWFRRRHHFPSVGPEIAIDLGIKDGEDFQSVAAVEASVQRTIDDIPSRSQGRPNIGLIQRSAPFIWTEGVRCNRNREYQEYGLAIFVEEALRGHRIATSLVSAVRIALKTEGIRVLVFDEISDIRPETQAGEFYRRLGGRIFYIDTQNPKTPKMLLPTSPSGRFPYKFD